MGRLFGSKRVLALVAGAAAIPVMLAASPAGATFSVVGTDATTKQVGGALASCAAVFGSASDLQPQIEFVNKGVGAVHGQSFYFDNQGSDMASLLPTKTPAQIIKESQDENINFPNKNGKLYETKTAHTANAEGAQLLQRRQYLIAGMSTSAGFTGNSNEDVVGTPLERLDKGAADPTGRWHAQVGGNTLTQRDVVNRMKDAWTVNSPDIVAVLKRLLNTNNINASVKKGDLAEREFVALAAGDAPGQGDKRCTPTGRSANLGWIRVTNKDGSTPINLRYSNVNGNALVALAYMYYGCRLGITSCTAASTGGPSASMTASAGWRRF